MAVYFKYKSAKDYDSIPILDQFISVGNLKLRIFESKRFGQGKDFDLLITNTQTKQDYVDHDSLIPKNTSVLIGRVPGVPPLPIVVKGPKQVCEEEKAAHSSSSAKYSKDFECDDFGDDVQGGMEWKRSPSGYVCHRCNVPGHLIQHCPTNGDPNYGIKKVTTSMLMATPRGIVGVLKPKEEVKGMSTASCSKRSVRDIPPELHCPLCKGLMKDAVIASKCCFSSFCDDKNILADALLPNMTLRITINRILNSSSSSSEHGVIAQDSASTHKEENCRPTAEEVVKMKKRKKPCDAATLNMQCRVVAESYTSIMNPAAYHPPCTGMSCGLSPVDVHHVLPNESFRGQYVGTRIQKEA
ncbi:unnamed protein product [Withania somnifera]